MNKLLREIPYTLLIPVALLIGLAPFKPEPHLVEKVRMLFSGTLSRPLDIFDLLMHSAPLLVLALKFSLERQSQRNE